MHRPPFYHNTIKNYIVAFGSVFDNILVDLETVENFLVPLHYSPKEKFIAFIQENANKEMPFEQVLPRMGFEIISMNLSPDRFTSPLNKIINRQRFSTDNGVTAITVLEGGEGYISPVTVFISGGGGSGAAATAVVEDGVITGVTITNPGAGYTEPPDISFAAETGTGATAVSYITVEERAGFIYNRIPYDFQFNLYIAARKFEDSLKIFESIAPFFTPELNVTIKDQPEFNLLTDIPITLTGSSYSIDYEGSFDTRRTILWTLTFNLRGWLYSDIKREQVIKKAIVDLSPFDVNRKFETFISEVIPKEARPNDPHEIIDSIIYE